MHRWGLWLFLCGILVAAEARAGDVAKFYQANPHPAPWGTLPSTGDVSLVPSSGDAKKDIEQAEVDGRVPVGWSSFVGRSASPSEVRGFAKRIGANYVIYRVAEQGSDAGPTVATGSFSRFGGVGFVMPSTIHRFDQFYLFLADAPRKGFGISIRLLTAEDQTRLGSNKGVYVAAVRRGSPAFSAEILPQDLLLSIAGQPIYDMDSMKAAVVAAQGTTAPVELVRSGSPVHKQVSFSSDGSW